MILKECKNFTENLNKLTSLKYYTGIYGNNDSKNDKIYYSFEYNTTWVYAYEFMLYFIQKIIDIDFEKKVEYLSFYGTSEEHTNIIEELRENDYKVRSCMSLQNEHNNIQIGGYSKMMEQKIQFTLKNQSDEIRLLTFEIPDDEHKFDNYMNSMEIVAHVDLAIDNYLKTL